MAVKTEKLERDYYKDVEKWMVKHFHCFDSAIDKGLAHGRIDIIGLRDIGGDFSGEVETIAIEVKRGKTPFANACGQTLGYRVYANRVYFADIETESVASKRKEESTPSPKYGGQSPFSPTDIQIASTLGIGLIYIRGRKCEEILTSPFYEPIKRLNLGLLERMGYGRCRFCDSTFRIRDKKENTNTWSKVSRNLKLAKQDEKGLMFWNYETSERKNKFDESKRSKEYSYDRRYVCAECIARFFAFQNPEQE